MAVAPNGFAKSVRHTGHKISRAMRDTTKSFVPRYSPTARRFAAEKNNNNNNNNFKSIPFPVRYSFPRGNKNLVNGRGDFDETGYLFDCGQSDLARCRTFGKAVPEIRISYACLLDVHD